MRSPLVAAGIVDDVALCPSSIAAGSEETATIQCRSRPSRVPPGHARAQVPSREGRIAQGVATRCRDRSLQTERQTESGLPAKEIRVAGPTTADPLCHDKPTRTRPAGYVAAGEKR